MRRAALITLALGLVLVLAAPALAARLKDDSGREVTWDHPFERVISLYGAHTENLFSLGLTDEIIGVSMSEDYPPAALEKPRFSHRDDPERFLAAKPDLVLIRPMIDRGYPQLRQRLEQFGIAVVSLQPTTPYEMLAYWRKLGALTGRPHQAEAMAEQFEYKLHDIRQRVAAVPQAKRPRVYFESIHRRMKTFAPDSMAVFALQAAGGVNVAADAEAVHGTNIAAYGKERILAKGADIDVFLAQVGTMNQISRADILGEPGFAAIKAVADGRVYLIDERLISRPTLRLLQGMAELQQILYPKLEARP